MQVTYKDSLTDVDSFEITINNWDAGSRTFKYSDDYLFEGYELDDALEAANAALEDDVSVFEQDGGAGRVAPFTRKEIVPRLERLFFRGQS